MHLSLHKKAYRDILLIANGHEVYKNDLSKFVQNIHHIDNYSDDEHCLNSLDSFKNYIKNKNLLDRETKVVYASGLEGKKDIQQGIIVSISTFEGKVGVAVGITNQLTDKFDAVKFVKLSSEIIGGQGGGGRKDFAQAGGQDQSKIDNAFEKIKSLI